MQPSLPTQTSPASGLAKALAFFTLVAFTLTPDIANALQRGDTGYICYTRSSGFMWARQRWNCQLMVLEVIGHRYRVEYLHNCSFDDRRRGDRELLEAVEVYRRPCPNSRS